ncbi:MAG: Rpn family recombination-promoting nuclease/putative transposase [Lachnospiraceae bacterium]|nr:Rpn family recombination-promoting nuclease/putative transposase [Lachnospiraceae bacterium]
MFQNTAAASANTSFLNATGRIDYNMTNDYMFRAVLQRSEHTQKHLIASLLHLDPDSIVSIEILNPIVLGRRFDKKTFVLDVAILLNSQTRINLEMQVLDKHDWPDRSLSYLCRNFDHISKGKWYTQVCPAIHIGFLNFTPFPGEPPEFYATYQMLNVKSHHVYSDKFRLSVVDLTHTELATAEDRKWHIDHWAKLFRATTWEDIKMLAQKYSDISQTAEALYALNAEEDIRLQCQAREDYDRWHSMTENLLKEKDATIADQAAIIEELRAQVEALKNK